MRIRLWNAFASNNSGSYTIVGRFREATQAEATAALLRPVLAEHSQWRDGPGEGEPPLHRFLAERGLTLDDEVGLSDDWPQDEPPPQVVAIGHQVLVHCDYTVTMPRFIGELFYAEGGRVEVELDHAHHATVVLLDLWIPWQEAHDKPEESREAMAQLMERLWLGPLSTHTSERVPAACRPTEWGVGMELGVVFEDLVAGVAEVQALVAENPAQVRVRVFEATDEGSDPLAFLRGQRSTVPGEHQVILWQAGPDRATTLRAIRQVIGQGLGEARALLDDLPAELLTSANRHDAEEALRVLTEAGATAEVLRPEDRRPR
ncbi:ribosomal protein L7/L12 [Paraliomyxa miuraensis]|uniref:ribosomal protein L7/L12 n=1 Tax=Paraliomyxa miuraensis TaxID=376150 RepID=UPI002251EC0D|nr:ribosomal protein L7/L12 [Paraliomyxa miuraensis]MCX4239411.1 ribosomal protein L7/L12 [Paraliomyxa miuraensis]